MVLNIKILIILFFLSFVLLLYKLNKLSRVILIETSDRVLENVEINERHRQPSPVLVNYFSDLLNKRPNLLTYPLLMTTSFIYNKKECINEESYELDHIKQTIELKKLSMSTALLVFLVIGIEWNNLDVFSSTYQKGFSITLPLGIHSGIILGYDHLSIPFILLLSFVFPIVFMSNWTTVKLGEMKYYLATILSSHYFLIIVFLVIDILMFYISFEIILPFFFILLGMFGGVQKFRAMYYLFLYTLWGSLFMLLEFLTKIGENGTGVMGLLEDLQLSSSWGLLGSIGIILAFSIKTPIVPFHLWLPLAHGDANVSGSIVLASIVLKMALYGFIRILIFILLLAFSSAQLTMFSIFVFSLLFASATTMRQNDLKVLVAYSSVAHMGSTLLGGFSNNQFGIFGSILFSIAHGVVSPALFIFVGALFYDRIGSRIMNYLKGLLLLYPLSVAMLLPVIFGNMGTPLTANFVAELECILATFMTNILMGILAGLSIVLSACYSIYMFNRISTGSISSYLTTAPDTNKKEFSMLMPLIIIMILLGIIPSVISSPIDLGLSHFLLDVREGLLSLCVLILSLILNSSFIVYVYQNIKYLIKIFILKLKYVFTQIRNKEDNQVILGGNCCSSHNKDDYDNYPRPNSGTSSNDKILNSRRSHNDEISDSEIYDNDEPINTGSLSNINTASTQNITSAPIEEESNALPQERADNSSKEVANNVVQEGVGKLHQKEGDNSIQEEANKLSEEVADKWAEEIVNESSQNEGTLTSSKAIDIPERVDTTDPNLRHLAKGLPEEPGVLEIKKGVTNLDESEEGEVGNNSTNPNEGGVYTNEEGSVLKEVTGNDTDDSSSYNNNESSDEDNMFAIDPFDSKSDGTSVANAPQTETTVEGTNLNGSKSKNPGLSNPDYNNPESNNPESKNPESNNPGSDDLAPNAGVSTEISEITDLLESAKELSNETNKMINTNIGSNHYNPDFSDSDSGLHHIYWNPSNPFFNIGQELTYIYKPGCITEESKFKFSLNVIENSPCIEYSYIDNIITISCGSAILMATLILIIKIFKLLRKLRWENLDNVNHSYTKSQFFNIDFMNSDSSRPNGDGSSPSGEGNGSNNERPSEGDGSNNGRPSGLNESGNNGEGSTTVGNSADNEYPLEGQWGRNEINQRPIPQGVNNSNSPNAQPSTSGQRATNTRPNTSSVPMKKTGFLRKNKPRKEINLPTEYEGWKKTVERRKIFNRSPDTPDTPPNSPVLDKNGIPQGYVSQSEPFSLSDKDTLLHRNYKPK
jgi:NADH-ubiquinone oxidoreductase chain 4